MDQICEKKKQRNILDPNILLIPEAQIGNRKFNGDIRNVSDAIPDEN